MIASHSSALHRNRGEATRSLGARWLLSPRLRLANASKVMRESDNDKIADIHRQMRVVLARDWDPIGVGDGPGAFDEYFSYVRCAHDVAIKTRSAEAVARHLIEIECDRMALHPRSVSDLLPVGEKIVQLVSQITYP